MIINRPEVVAKIVIWYILFPTLYLVKSFTTFMITRLISTKDIADADNELSIDA
jgi:hypothetical protein